MRSLAAKFVASCEELEQTTATAPLEGGADSMEQGMLDAAQVEAEVAENEQALADAQDVATGLEAIANDLAAFAKDGGLDTKGAVMMRRAVNAYTTRLGIASLPVASVESFGGPTSRVSATVASMEAIKDILTNVWNWIKEQINKIRTTIKDYWLKTFAAAPRLAKRAEALKAKANNASGAAKEPKIDINVQKYLHINKKVPSLDTGLGALGAVVEKVFTVLPNKATTACKTYGELIAAVNLDTDTTFNDSIKGKKTDWEKCYFNGADVDAKTNVSSDKRYTGRSAMATDELMGGVRLVRVAKSGNFDLATEAGVTVFVKDILPTQKFTLDPVLATEPDMSGSISIDTLTPSVVGGLCDKIIGICEVMSKYAQAYKDQDRAKDEVLKGGDTLTKSAASATELSAGVSSTVKAMATGVKYVSDMVDHPATNVNSHALRVMAAILTVCEKSLAQYSAS